MQIRSAQLKAASQQRHIFVTWEAMPILQSKNVNICLANCIIIKGVPELTSW
jgi:hypothetical protein